MDSQVRCGLLTSVVTAPVDAEAGWAAAAGEDGQLVDEQVATGHPGATHTSLTEDEGDSVNAIEGMRLWGRLSPPSSSDAILDVVNAVRFGEPVST